MPIPTPKSLSQPARKRTLASIIGVAAAAGVLALTPRFEGTKLKTYRDIGGVLTYCTGATEDAVWGKTYTPDECRAQLDRDLARHAEGVVGCTGELTDGQRIAFVDLAYNIGVGAFCKSTVARKANAGDVPGSCEAVLMWNKVAGREVAGLTRRRQAEREICLGRKPA